MMAVGVGFEPTEVVETSALFKSAALNRSAIPPVSVITMMIRTSPK